ncbi:hypothetical protein [Paracoccus sp. SY]|uniref:hypothetical protein n=1 Tax=Paracoccus sp. SY TaxID=1330255 RepID=UPI000CD2C371|nr:hypothetical protein [Paracoccus sp. SY]
MPEGLLGGFGTNLRRFCLVLHAQGQVTTERLTAILNGIGMDISKRQVLRILTFDLDGFVAEDQAIPPAGLATASFISLDDTGARHALRDGITRQIGGMRFSVFRTGCLKSRLNFLSLLWAGCEDYIIIDAALAYMRQRKVAADQQHCGPRPRSARLDTWRSARPPGPLCCATPRNTGYRLSS